jgi:hypothetical protein
MTGVSAASGALTTTGDAVASPDCWAFAVGAPALPVNTAIAPMIIDRRCRAKPRARRPLLISSRAVGSFIELSRAWLSKNDARELAGKSLHAGNAPAYGSSNQTVHNQFS